MLMNMLIEEARKLGHEPEDLLLHYLAIQALPGVIAINDSVGDDTIETDVDIAYEYAEEMLKRIKNE